MRFSRKTTVHAAIAAIILVPTMTSAQTCTANWIGEDGDAWQRSEHWLENEVPGGDDIVCVENGTQAGICAKICTGGTNAGLCCSSAGGCPSGSCDDAIDAEAAILFVRPNGQQESSIQLYPETLLTLGGRFVCNGGSNDGELCDPNGSPTTECPSGTCDEIVSDIDDVLIVFGRAAVALKRDITIAGDGRVHAGWLAGGCGLEWARIDVASTCDGGANDGNPCALSAHAHEDCPGGSCTWIAPASRPKLIINATGGLQGSFWTHIPLVNNTQVVANEVDNTLILGCDGNTGTGDWKVAIDYAEPSRGVGSLHVNGTIVDASGAFMILDAQPPNGCPMPATQGTCAELQFNAECTTGNAFDLIDAGKGAVTFTEDVTTSGNFLRSGEFLQWINVASGVVVTFD